MDWETFYDRFYDWSSSTQISRMSSLLALGLGLAGKSKPHKHNGKCNGDCANCPAHYGYRYGRWYYGHHHTHGCEFGGNGGL